MRRALPIIFLLLALGACKGPDDPRAPFTDSRIPPGLETRFYPPQGWAWGLIRVGKAPPLRYGVAAPPTTPRGQVIILPGLGETAEAWFGVVRDLNARGYVVWVLEGSGQGGSGRYRLPRDIIDAPSLDPDVVAVTVVAARLAPRGPRYLIASNTSAAVAARAAALGLSLDGLILFGPDFRSPVERARQTNPAFLSKERWLRRLGLGRLPEPGGGGWVANDRFMDIPELGQPAFLKWLTRRWQKANPDLRMGSPSVDWGFAYEAQADAVRLAWPKVTTRTLVVGDDICGARANCLRAAPLRPTDQMSSHAAFVAQILGFIDPPRAGLAPAPATVTLDEQS